MQKPQIDSSYTDMWTNDAFSQSRVKKYGSKFKTKWEKAIKHDQQIRFIKKYLKDELYWCDFPIGSGRLEDELSTDKMLGLDISDSFLAYNSSKGRSCEKADLLNQTYHNEFDVVTSLHTVSAFSECDKILKGYIRSLKVGGTLIVDVTNKNGRSSAELEIYKAYTKGELTVFLNDQGCQLIDYQYHDFWDHPRFIKWRDEGPQFNKELWWLLNRLYFSKIRLVSKVASFFLNIVERCSNKKNFCKILIAVKKVEDVSE